MTLLWFAALRSLFLLFCLTASVYCRPLSGSASLSCQISDLSVHHRSLRISCTTSVLPAGKSQLRFLDQFAGLDRLSERVFALRVKDAAGAVLPLEIHGGGQYYFSVVGHAQQVSISYELRLARALDPSHYALSSSIGPEASFLLISDLLPQVCAEGVPRCEEPTLPLRLRILAPEGWQIATTEAQAGEFFEIVDPQRAVFFLGRLRGQELKVSRMRLRVAIAGSWGFTDQQVTQLVEAISREQAAMIGSVEQGDFLVALAPFPLPLTGLRSSGLSRGRTIILMLNAAEDWSRTLAHYQRHLAHELFHYYLPNAFRLRENFDWFWEGFTRYIALTTLLRLQLLGMRQYLDALGEEYEAYAANPLRARLSLIAASPEKFATQASYDLVYRKGMLVAALYDLELRWQSEGKRNLMTVIGQLYQNYAGSEREVGNREVLAQMGQAGAFTQFIRDYIAGTREINLAKSLAPYGLIVEHSISRPRVEIAPRLSAKQRALLAQFGN